VNSIPSRDRTAAGVIIKTYVRQLSSASFFR